MSIWSWLKRRRMGLDEDDFQEEIRAHLEMAEQDRIESGTDREVAHYAARKEFGNVMLTTEAARRVWTPWWLECGRVNSAWCCSKPTRDGCFACRIRTFGFCASTIARSTG
jgi:hypothetical protein